MANIKDIKVTQIIDSRGFPAVHVTTFLEDGIDADATISLGSSYVPQLRKDGREEDHPQAEDNDVMQVMRVLDQIIRPSLRGVDSSNQQLVDKTLVDLDGTPDKTKIKPSTMTVVSMSIAKAAARSAHTPLFQHLQNMIHRDNPSIKIPLPMFTIIDGGKNANHIIEFEEILSVPASFKSFDDSLKMGLALHDEMRNLLIRENLLPLVGEKGGFGPFLSTNEDSFSLVKQAVESINLRLGYDIYLGMDANAGSFYRDNHYTIKDKSLPITFPELQEFYEKICELYHILYMEDPFEKNDLEGWTASFKSLNQKTILAGDYFTSTNPYRLQSALEKRTINGVVIKPSQVGTITEALAFAEMARIAGLKIIVSARTNETNDTFLADFSVAVGADYVKFGGTARGERVAKINRLLEIQKIVSGA